MRVSERLIGRLLAASLIGAALGYAFGASVAHDAGRGRTITMKQYVDDFDRCGDATGFEGGPAP